MAGCTKKYTDPSSLRKHVKNHNSRDQTHIRRKSYKEINQNPIEIPSTAKQRRYSESSTCTYSSDTIATPNTVQTPTILSNQQQHFIFDDVFNDISENQNSEFESGMENDIQTNTMNFNELSDCIVTIENNHQNNRNLLQNIDDNSFKMNSYIHTDHLHDVVDEFVSFECVKKFLNEQNLDCLDSALQNHLNVDYFSEL